MLDQYENKVPDDLVVLPEIANLTDDEVKVVVNADWYDVSLSHDPEETDTIYLMASAKAINYLESNIDIAELGGIFIEVIKVDDIFKRWNNEDGFYHT